MARRTHWMSNFNTREVAQLYKTARRVVKYPGFHILMAPAVHSYGRILVVTPRISGNAPERNLIRRRLKSIFLEEKLYLHGFDCLILIKKEGIHLSFAQLKKLLLLALSKAAEYGQNQSKNS